MTVKNSSLVGTIALVCIVLMVSVGCGGEAAPLTPSEASAVEELGTFSNFGFSFEYPQDHSIYLEGLLGDVADENSGIVQVGPKEGGLPLFAVSWVNTWRWGLEGGLDAGFHGIESWEGIEHIEKGEIVETAKLGRQSLYQIGHRMLYQYYTANNNTQGMKVHGIVGVFYCDKTQRAFSLVTMNTATPSSSSQIALDELKIYLDTFVCH